MPLAASALPTVRRPYQGEELGASPVSYCFELEATTRAAAGVKSGAKVFGEFEHGGVTRLLICCEGGALGQAPAEAFEVLAAAALALRGEQSLVGRVVEKDAGAVRVEVEFSGAVQEPRP